MVLRPPLASLKSSCFARPAMESAISGMTTAVMKYAMPTQRNARPRYPVPITAALMQHRHKCPTTVRRDDEHPPFKPHVVLKRETRRMRNCILLRCFGLASARRAKASTPSRAVAVSTGVRRWTPTGRRR